MDLDRLGTLLAVPDLPGRLERVEARIDRAIEVDLDRYRDGMRRVATAGGKRLRPAMTIACAQLGGCWGHEVVEVAAAAELVQIGSLVHDDIIDAADTRRGIPTMNSLEGDDAAIVAGDLVLARAGELAGGVSAAAGVLVNATIARLCVGQFAEMVDLHDTGRTVESHLASVEGKTAALFDSACRLGAMCSGAGGAVEAELGEFGRSFGMAFQLLDDVLDVVGDAELLGKPVGVDIPAGVYTLPVLHALAGPRGQELRDLLGTDPGAAREIVVASGGVERARAAMTDWASRATDALVDLDGVGPLAGAGEQLDALRRFPLAYIDWALSTFAPGAHG